VQNGVLLRADLAALYDDGWFGLQWRGPELILVSSADVQVTEYERLLEASVFRLPTDPGRVPHSELVDAHRKFKMRERGKV
jgi:hypothetical protein